MSNPFSEHQSSPRPIRLNLTDLEAKGRDYLARVKSEALQIMSQARSEVVKLRENAVTEIRSARTDMLAETDSVRKQLESLKQRLRGEEESFRKRKEQLEGEVLKLKQNVKQNEDIARKKGYDEGYAIGYEEAKGKGYADGELQAGIDHADHVRNEVEIRLAAKLETTIPALKQIVNRLENAKQELMLRWEAAAVHVATVIAEQAISRQLPQMPDVPVRLLREVLELGAGSVQARIRLHPDDFETLRPQANVLIDEMSGIAKTELVPDKRITSGGCVLETSLGVIDNRIEARLLRIKEELTSQ